MTTIKQGSPDIVGYHEAKVMEGSQTLGSQIASIKYCSMHDNENIN